MLLERYTSVALCPIYSSEAPKYAIIESKLEEADNYNETAIEQEQGYPADETNAYSESAAEPDESMVDDSSEYNSCPRIFDDKTGQFLEQGIESQEEEHSFEDTTQSPVDQTLVNIKREETTEKIVLPFVNTRRTRSHRSFDSKPVIVPNTHKDVIPKKRGRLAKSITTDDISQNLQDNQKNVENETKEPTNVIADEQIINVFVEKEKRIDENLVKRPRGRSKGSPNKQPQSSKTVATLEQKPPSESEQRSPTKSDHSTPPKKRARKSRSSPASNKVLSKHRDLPMHDIDDDDEGESDNEFPARDSDNEDWPAQQTLDDFPKQIIENGLLLVKGKKLMTMICKYKIDNPLAK